MATVFILPTTGIQSYRGKYPTRARSISSGATGHHVELNNGTRLWSMSPIVPDCGTWGSLRGEYAGALASAGALSDSLYAELVETSGRLHGMLHIAGHGRRERLARDLRLACLAIADKATPAIAPMVDALHYISETDKQAVTALLTDVLAAGYSVDVCDGEETTVKRSTDATVIIPAMGTTDHDILRIYRPDGERVGTFTLIWNNGSADECISDFSWRESVPDSESTMESIYAGVMAKLESCTADWPAETLTESPVMIDGNGVRDAAAPSTTEKARRAQPDDRDRALATILSIIGNVDHSTGHGPKAAAMRGDMLNDIRTIARRATGQESGA